MADVLDGMTEGVLVVDADWRITRANAVVEDLLERERAALVGADVRDVFPRSAASTFHDHFGGDTPERAEIAFEEYFPELDVWLRVRTAVLGESLAVYHRDVTDRKDVVTRLPVIPSHVHATLRSIPRGSLLSIGKPTVVPMD